MSDVILDLAKHPEGKPRPIDHALLGEFVALRTIVANLVYSTFTNEGRVTPEQMQAFVET